VKRSRILLVEDEPSVRLGARDYLEERGWTVIEADSCATARNRFEHEDVDAVICDFALPDGDALSLLPLFKGGEAGVPVIILSGQGTIELAVRAIQQGADHFMTKPIELPTLETLLARLLDRERERKRTLAGRVGRVRKVPDPFLGTSPVIRRLADDARRIVNSDSPVLLLGETGAGKGVLASWLHAHSSRAEEPYVDLNCAGLSGEFLQSELFGHERGAFTGATAAKPGLFEVAHRGTMFLDEIGDTDLEVQGKLLKAIEEKEFRRMGALRNRHVDVRIIAATHHDLHELATSGTFRRDLYFRISTLPLRVPSLRERPEDIVLLARHLLTEVGLDMGRTDLSLSPQATEALGRYDWPGNVRELRNVLERAALLSPTPVIEAPSLRFETGPSFSPAANELSLTLAEVERNHIERVLAAVNGHVEAAAVRLGVARSTLYDMLRRHGIRRHDTEASQGG